MTEGFLLGGYTFTQYKSGESAKPIAEIVVLSPIARRKDAITAFDEAQVVARAVATTRDWVNMPPGDFTPPAFADAVVEAGKAHARGKHKVTIKVLDEKQLAELGCGGILGVGLGSSAPPRLVELTYSPRGAKQHLALVGKGITFDSGGLTIKPGASMPEMKSDMAGAAAVVQATLAIATLGLPLKVTAYTAMAENMLSGSAMRPGDVLTMCDGTTVEVLNTDAEGRLVLADALIRATQQQPDVIVDVATLTAHMVIALGDQVAGVMGDDAIVDQVLAASKAGGRAQLADADPRAHERADPVEQDRRPLPARLDPLGRRPLRRRLPARVHRRRPVGAPGHRRDRRTTRAVPRVTSPRAAPATASPRWCSSPGR